MVKKASTSNAKKSNAKKSTASKAKDTQAQDSKALTTTGDDFVPMTADDDMDSRPDHITETKVHTETEGASFAPTIKLLQSLSPELEEEEEKFLPDAEAGDLVVDDGTQQTLFDGGTGINVIPLLSRKRWNEWIPRKKGGGFVASYASKAEMEAGFEPGNEVQVTIEYLCVTRDVSPEKEFTPVVLQFNTPTKLGVAREFASLIQKYRTMFGVVYKVKSKKAKNKQGQRYFNYSIEPLGWVQEQLYSHLEKLKNENEAPFIEEPSRTGNSGDTDDDDGEM